METERDTERSKAIARWFAIAILAGFLYWQRGTYPELRPEVMWGIIVGSAGINALHSVFLFTVKQCPPFYKYVTVGLDLLVLSMTIRYTGFNQSPFFYTYFLVLVSNCIRYGLLMSLYVACVVNVMYAVTLSLGPHMQSTVLGGEGLKILGFWTVALYGGGVAARIRRQVNVIESYEETIAELRTRLAGNVEKNKDG